jgi:hypothetical protein
MKPQYKSYFKLIIRPVVLFAVRHGIKYQDFLEIGKSVFVEIAEEEIIKQGEKITTSKISAISGLRRPEIKKISEGHENLQAASVISRVVAQWEQDPLFKTRAGKPKVLSYGEDGAEFNNLVGRVSTDLHPASILFELQRLDLAEITSRGISLKSRHHVKIEDLVTGFRLLSEDIHDLISSVEHNMLADSEVKNLHAKTVYDNIYHEDLHTIKQWLLSEGAKFHHKLRNYLAKFDKDINLQKGKTPGARVTFCTFATTEETKHEK